MSNMKGKVMKTIYIEPTPELREFWAEIPDGAEREACYNRSSEHYQRVMNLVMQASPEALARLEQRLKQDLNM